MFRATAGSGSSLSLATKILIGCIIGLIATAAIIGPAVYFGLQGKKNLPLIRRNFGTFSKFLLNPIRTLQKSQEKVKDLSSFIRTNVVVSRNVEVL